MKRITTIAAAWIVAVCSCAAAVVMSVPTTNELVLLDPNTVDTNVFTVADSGTAPNGTATFWTFLSGDASAPSATNLVPTYYPASGRWQKNPFLALGGSTVITNLNNYVTNLTVYSNLYVNQTLVTSNLWVTNLYVTNLTVQSNSIFRGRVTINTNLYITTNFFVIDNDTNRVGLWIETNNVLRPIHLDLPLMITNKLSFSEGMTNVMFASGKDIIITNGATQPGLLLKDGSGASVGLSLTPSGSGVLNNSANSIFLPSVYNGTASFQPVGGVPTLGDDSSGSVWTNQFFGGTNFHYGYGPGTTNRVRLEESLSGSRAIFNLTSKTNNVDGPILGFNFETNGQVVASIAANSGYSGAGTLFLSDDGTYKAGGSGGPTINPTTGYLPYRSNATTFADSPWYRMATNKLSLYGTTPVFISGNGSLTTLGYGAGAAGGQSTSVGYEAGKANLGSANVFVGDFAGTSNTVGTDIVALGRYAASSTIDVSYGLTAVGSKVLQYTPSADGVTAVGYAALQGATNAYHSTVLGYQAANTIPMLKEGIAIGFNSQLTASPLTNTIAIGSYVSATNNHEIVIGNTNNTKAIFPITSYTGTGANFLSDDGTYKATGAGAGGGNMTNNGASVQGMIPVYTDTSGTQLTPTNTLVSLSVSNLTFAGGAANIVPVFDGNTNLVASRTTTNELDYLYGVTNSIQTQFSGKASLSGDTMTGPLLSTSTTTNGPSNNELATAGWVRNLLVTGTLLYNSGDTNASGFDSPTYAYVTTIPTNGSRTYASGVLSAGSYFGSVMTTNTYMTISGDVVVQPYIESTGGAANSAYTVHAEIYYTYDKTNLLGDWESGIQTLIHGAQTNKYSFAVPVPTTTATNGSGFYIVRRMKVNTQTGTDSLKLCYGTNTPSSVSLPVQQASSSVTYAAVTNALGLTGSTTTYLRSDGTQATPPGGGGSPGGSSAQVQYNDGAGNFAGTAALTATATLVTTTNIASAGKQTNFMGTEVWVDVVRDFGADPTGATDSTSAIQAALDAACGTTNSCTASTVYFRPGTYLLSSAATSSALFGGETSQLLLPFKAFNVTNWSSIRILGPDIPTIFDGTSSSGVRPRNGAVLYSTVTSAGSHIIAPVGRTNTQPNNITVIFQNMNVFVQPTFAGTALNLSNVVSAIVENCSVAQTNMANSCTEPVTGSVGIDLPRYNMANQIIANNLNVVGFDYGIRIGEHNTMGFLNIVACKYGASFKASNHGNTLNHLYTSGCRNAVNVEAASLFDIFLLNNERMGTSDWKTNYFDVEDGSNNARGRINWKVKDLVSSTYDHKIRVDGGQNLLFCEQQYDPWGVLNVSQSSTVYLRGPHLFYTDNSARGGCYSILKARGTSTAPTSASNGDAGQYNIGFLDSAGAYQTSASFVGAMDGSAGSGTAPVALQLHTGTSSSAKTNRMTISSTGRISGQTGTNVFAYYGGVLSVNTTAVGNVGAGADDLQTYSVGANVLNLNGEHIEFDMSGSFTNNAHNKQLKVIWGSTTLCDSGVAAFNNLSWRAFGKIVRTGAATQVATCTMTISGTLLGAVTTQTTTQTAPTETLTGAVVLKCTGEDSDGSPTDSAIAQNLLIVNWRPNGN